MRIPGPEHPISIGAHPHRVEVRFNGRIIAKTERALAMQESNYPVVLYLPREDTEASLLTRSDKATYCPYKGDEGYFSIAVDGQASENAVWTYEAPYPAVAAIKDHVAFYADRVDIQETDTA